MRRLTIICISFIIVSLMFAGQSYAQIDPESVLGAWLLDEGAGDITADASGNGNDGTLMGPPNWVAGNFGNALEFTGSSTYVDCNNDPALNVDLFSVSFWCNIPSTQDWNHMVSRGQHNGGDPGGVNWGVMMVANEEIILFEVFNDTGWLSIRANTTTSEWHHVAATYDGDTAQFYHDGQLAATGTGGILLDENRPFIIGARSDAGSAGGFFSGSIDEVGYFNTILSPEDIETIMNNGLAEITGGTPVAVKPQPAHGAEDVPRDVVFSWKPGEYAAATNGHKVYFGESFNDVNDATGGAAQDANSYTLPQRLDLNTTYYWRVDEVNAPPTSQIEFKGGVWSFTTEPIAYAVENITATASSSYAADQGPENTINSLGLDADDLHSTEPAAMWLSGEEPNGAWIEYELDKVYKLHEMLVWNHNGMMEFFLGFGLKDVTIEYSTNGTDYTTLGTTHEFVRAPGTVDYAHNTTVDFGGAAAKYVRLTANSHWGGTLQYGLSEVRFLYIPLRAREPQPESGATDVAVDVTLVFRAGRDAVEHNVYVSTDEQAVIDSNVPVSIVTEAQHGPISLDLGETYYWKVNEVNMAESPTMLEGDIWNFTTREYFVVDDFEDYNDWPPDEIWRTWVDGYGVSANNATVGYPEPDWYQDEHYVETAIVHGGDQSMPFFYDNTGTAAYSEGERTFAVPQDWTATGVQTLALYFHGTAGNTGQLYMKVNGFKVVYDGNAGNLSRTGWQAWNIELASFDTNLQSVTTLAIGIDDNGASGTLYFDDIRLYPYSRQFITPVEPNNAGLVMHLGFDEGFGTTAGDSSGNGNDGTLNGGPQWVAGQIGGALDFDGVDDFVFTGKSASDLGIDANKPKTISAWVYTRAFNNGGIFDLGNRSDGQNFSLRTLDTDNRWRTQHWGGANDHDFDYSALNVWVHFALVYDGTESTVYANGIVVSSKATNLNTTDDNPFQVGCYGWQNDYFDGIIDDVRIYDYALSLEDVAWLAGRTEPFDKPF